jgi:hypothetical protein
MRSNTNRPLTTVGLTILLQLYRFGAAGILAVFSISTLFVLSSQIPFLGLVSNVFSHEKDHWKILASVGIVLVVSVYSGAAVMRMLSRAFPRRADDHLRLGLVIVMSLVLLAIAALSVCYVFRPGPVSDEAFMRIEEDMKPDDALFFEIGLMIGNTVFVQIGIAMAFVVVLPLAWSLTRHLIRTEPSGILFLRRFGGRGDAALMAALLRSTPKGSRLAFITSPAATPTSWDPLIVAMAGFRWFRPWSNIPLFLSSSNSKWQQDVYHWVEKSELVVFDASETSSSLAIEREMVYKAGAQSRSLFLTRSLENSNHGHSVQKVPTIYFKLSWLRAVPRIAIGCTYALAAGYITFQVLGGLIGVFIVWLSLAHPSLTLGTEQALKKTLRQLLSSRCDAVSTINRIGPA